MQCFWYLYIKPNATIFDKVIKLMAPPCTGGRSPMVPTSVDKLRPGDIDIIGAMGDSLTAGFGIFGTNLVNMFVENRGASAFGGGQTTWRQILTLPNILKVLFLIFIHYIIKTKYTKENNNSICELTLGV